MGVTGLWNVVQPVARPVKLETLNRRRLAVDASIWIYQFLKAVRDKEGNALRNSHVVGFFRRICKLLFFGIRPVFVFDGGAPALKRQTIVARKSRREGRREDAVRTAGRLLAVQMHRRAEEEDRRRRVERARPAASSAAAEPEQEEPLPEKLVYAEEQLMTPAERARNQNFRKKDAYHLPELDVSLSEMGAPNDPRIMSQEELEEYAKQFSEGEDVSLYDFGKIDFDSPFFLSLPAPDRYNILNAARLRSRLRMGYSKEQLDRMFPDRMAFSRFQIERVKERNDLTQRLMGINGMDPNDLGTGRIAGEKGKEYMLVKNDGVEGGWVLGVVSNRDEGKQERPIDVDKPLPPPRMVEDSDDSFEDVPVEGLNRLPKRPKVNPMADEQDAVAVQMGIYNDIQDAGNRENRGTERMVDEGDDENDGLFIPMEETNEDGEQFEDVIAPTGDDSEDEELQRAIQMSLEKDSDEEDNEMSAATQAAGDKARSERLRREKVLEFGKRSAASGASFAHYANARAARAAPRQKGPDETANPELRAAFEAGRKMGHKRDAEDEAPATQPAPPPPPSQPKEMVLSEPGSFKGPLPFESINMGKSLFSRKKKQPEPQPEPTADKAEPEANKEEEGGFDKDEKEKPKPLPPWFAENMSKEGYQHSQIKNGNEAADSTDQREALLRRPKKEEIIDLEAEDRKAKEPIKIDDSDEEMEDVEVEAEVAPDTIMDDVAEKMRVEPPESAIPEYGAHGAQGTTGVPQTDAATDAPTGQEALKPEAGAENGNVYSPGEDSFEWEESDYEEREKRVLANPPANASEDVSSPEPDFEDVEPPPKEASPASAAPGSAGVQALGKKSPPTNTTGLPHNDATSPLPLPEDDDALDPLPPEEAPLVDDFSDPEDEDLMAQLAIEAEEHARFAAQLNVATGLQSARDYEQELKQLRSQQRADRRDADEVTTIMIQECQQLLRLFGLPYITAPMEAEAQCAELLRLGLVDGIVTDDSDIFLFGGTRVYKNMFSQAKFVEYFLFSDMEREYGLTRDRIIQIAHLLGSDYTEGIPGVGPVTALEIITEFGSVAAFQAWWADVQTGVAPDDTAKGFRKRFRKNATKIFLPPGFPDPRVDAAYLEPEVDADPQPFQWGVPDLEALRQFLMATIGWSAQRTDEILVPVIRDMNKRDAEGTQANMTHFFGGAGSAPRPVGGSGGGGSGRGGSGGGGQGGSGGGGSTTAAGAGREAYAPRRRAEGKSSRMENALERLHQQTRRRAAAGQDNGEEGGDAGQDAGGQEDTIETTTETAPPKKNKRKKKTTANSNAAAAERETASMAGEDKAQAADSDGVGHDDAEDEDEDDDDDDDGAYRPPKKASRKKGRARGRGRGKA